MNIVIAQHHPQGKQYVFRVPEALAKHIRNNQLILVETKMGVAAAKTVTGVIKGDDIKALLDRYGAALPLAPVVSFMHPELEKEIGADVRRELLESLKGSLLNEQPY